MSDKDNKDKLFFKVHAGIKSIVGKELIHNDAIAIIELVKNSKDAGAKNIHIVFIDEEELTDKSSILIIDDGKGMSLDDIRDKWLNVAYSEKKDDNPGQQYAGNKGIGRFSCDRLGEKLTAYTKAKNGDYLKVDIDWKAFEDKGINDEMSLIPIEYSTINEGAFLKVLDDYGATHSTRFIETGTILKIDMLREDWPTNKMAKLISELEKFSYVLDNGLEISIFSDNKNPKLSKKLNQKINNNILDQIVFKTTHIESEIDKEGKFIITSLYYQDEKVYNYKVKNPYKNLKNITTEIHYIDTLARGYFTKTVGMRMVDYGSIFLFYNNFRISPYGNSKNDWLGLDQRKAQGTARYLGTRELFGTVKINDEHKSFQVLSNREGLASNTPFKELIAYDKDEKTFISTDEEYNDEETQSYGYVINIIRQLESFVVDGLKWNKLIDSMNLDSKKVIAERDLFENPTRYKFNNINPENLITVNKRLLKSSWKIQEMRLTINYELINNITRVAEDKYQQFMEDFSDKIKDKSFADLTPTEKGNVAKIIKIEQEKASTAKMEQEKAEQQVETIKEETKQTIQQINSKNMFLKKVSNQDVEDLLVSMHSILVNTSIIRSSVLRGLKSKEISDDIKSVLHTISEANQKNFNVAKFATFYNFNDKQNHINGELTVFIHEYLNEAKKFLTNRSLDINDNLDLEIMINKDFIPLEIMMLLENVISNSQKASAKTLTVSNKRLDANSVQITFKDDGKGVLESRYVEDINLIFEKGETSTKGSGIGLYHAKKTIDKLGGKINISEYQNKFEMEVILGCD